MIKTARIYLSQYILTSMSERSMAEIMTEGDTEVPALITASLHDSDGVLVSPDPSGGTSGAAAGAFAFDLERSGEYRVELVFGREAVSIAGLDVQ